MVSARALSCPVGRDLEVCLLRLIDLENMGISSTRRSGVSKDMQTLIRGPVLGKSGGKRLAKGLCPEGKQDPSRAYS